MYGLMAEKSLRNKVKYIDKLHKKRTLSTNMQKQAIETRGCIEIDAEWGRTGIRIAEGKVDGKKTASMWKVPSL